MEETNTDLHEPVDTAPDGGAENQAYVNPADGEGESENGGGSETPDRDGRTAAPEDETAAKRRAEILEFFEEYGTDVDPRTIPPEVWQAVAGGRTLLAAYQAWELKKLRLENRAAQKATENKSRSAGSRSSLDGVKPRDAITEDWYKG
jgi:hypothetical protein